MSWKKLTNVLLLGWVLGGMAGWANSADFVVGVIRLKHRTAEQVLPLIRSLVSPGTASGAGGDIVVRTTQSNLAEVKKVIAQLDRVPKRLMITVRQDATDNGVEGASRPSRSYATRSADGDRSVQRMQVIEGGSAYVYVGQSVPVVLGGRGRRVMSDGREVAEPVTVIRETLSGFGVRPRVSGDSVTLDIEPRHDVPGSAGHGSIDQQRIATTVVGRIGAWIELGAIQPAPDVAADSTAYSTRQVTVRTRRILVRVDALD